MCPFCGGPIRGSDRGSYRAIPGEKDQPPDWTPCHITCGREQQEKGLPITIKWFVAGS